MISSKVSNIFSFERVSPTGSSLSRLWVTAGLLFAGLLFAGLLAGGCASKDTFLAVSVSTELVAGVEFEEVEVILYEGASTTDGRLQYRRIIHQANFPEDYSKLQTVAEFEAVPHGDYLICSRLLNPDETVLVESCTAVSLSQKTYVTDAALTRGCIVSDVKCPLTDGQVSQGLIKCLAGQCVDPKCDPSNPATRIYCPELFEFCTDEDVSSCPDVASCAEKVCASGICTARPVGGACNANEYCDTDPDDGGCKPLPNLQAIGDAGVPDGGDGGTCFAILRQSPTKECVSEWRQCVNGQLSATWEEFTNFPCGKGCTTGGDICDGAGDCVDSTMFTCP